MLNKERSATLLRYQTLVYRLLAVLLPTMLVVITLFIAVRIKEIED